MPGTVITTEHLILRRWLPEDRAPFAALNADPRVMEFQTSLLSRDQSDAFVNRIEEHFLEHGFGLFAAELQPSTTGLGRFIGFIGLQIPGFEAPFTPCVEIGWRLAADVWGQGLATEGARGVLKHSFEVIGLEEVVSFTAVINTRSQRVMQKIGMKHDPAEDFDHPRLPEGHTLRRHVLYRASPRDWRTFVELHAGNQ
jgi:RimJ/RimL family protein N-acetyltransferase